MHIGTGQEEKKKTNDESFQRAMWDRFLFLLAIFHDGYCTQSYNTDNKVRKENNYNK